MRGFAFGDGDGVAGEEVFLVEGGAFELEGELDELGGPVIDEVVGERLDIAGEKVGFGFEDGILAELEMVFQRKFGSSGWLGVRLGGDVGIAACLLF